MSVILIVFCCYAIQLVFLPPRSHWGGGEWYTVVSWSSLVEGDEQLDRPNSQTTLELCHSCVAYFFGFNINTTAFCLGRSSLHLLILKSSMVVSLSYDLCLWPHPVYLMVSCEDRSPFVLPPSGITLIEHPSVSKSYAINRKQWIQVQIISEHFVID